MYRRIKFSEELIEKRFYSVALKILETAMVLHTNEFKIYEQISKCYILLANFKEALTILYKYLVNNPNSVEALMKIGISILLILTYFVILLGDAYFLKKELNNSLDNYLKCKSLDNNNPNVLKKIAKVYLCSSPVEFSNALNYLNQALKIIEEEKECEKSDIIILISILIY